MQFYRYVFDRQTRPSTGSGTKRRPRSPLRTAPAAASQKSDNIARLHPTGASGPLAAGAGQNVDLVFCKN